MKRCPQCNRVESDEALKFCRADGTVLINDSSSIDSDAGTVRLGSSLSSEIETSVLPDRTDVNINRATAPTTVLSAAPIPSTTRELSKQKRRWVLIAPIAGAVLVISIAGYFYFSRKSNATIQSV